MFEQRYERGKPTAPLNDTAYQTPRDQSPVQPDGQVFETLDFSFDVLAQRLARAGLS